MFLPISLFSESLFSFGEEIAGVESCGSSRTEAPAPYCFEEPEFSDCAGVFVMFLRQ